MKVTVEDLPVPVLPPKKVTITLSMDEAKRLAWLLFRIERVPIGGEDHSLFSRLTQAGVLEVKPRLSTDARIGMEELGYRTRLYHIADEAQ